MVVDVPDDDGLTRLHRLAERGQRIGRGHRPGPTGRPGRRSLVAGTDRARDQCGPGLGHALSGGRGVGLGARGPRPQLVRPGDDHAAVDGLHDGRGAELPQPLTYLVDDTARRFGSIRVGHAEAFLRADDEAALAELLHHPKAASLGLRRLAPTVLISSTPLDVLLPRLRELGAAPVVEAIDGTVVVSRPDQLRARTPRTEPDAAAARQGVSRARAALVMRAIRSGDEVAAARPPGRSGSMAPADALAALREAVEAGEAVVIGYVDHHGMRSDRLVRPRRIESGQLIAHDLRADDTRTFPVHRITAVTAVETRS